MIHFKLALYRMDTRHRLDAGRGSVLRYVTEPCESRNEVDIDINKFKKKDDPISRVLYHQPWRLSFISAARHRTALSIYPPSSAEPTLTYGIFDLSTHKVYPGEMSPLPA